MLRQKKVEIVRNEEPSFGGKKSDSRENQGRVCAREQAHR